MKRIATILIALAAVAIGCSDDPTPVSYDRTSPNGVVVTGTIIAIDDAVPVDGGVTIDLRLDGGKTIVAYLTSFFTAQPPPPGKEEAYQVILTLEPGDRVRVRGEATEHGVRIESIARLRS